MESLALWACFLSVVFQHPHLTSALPGCFFQCPHLTSDLPGSMLMKFTWAEWHASILWLHILKEETWCYHDFILKFLLKFIALATWVILVFHDWWFQALMLSTRWVHTFLSASTLCFSSLLIQSVIASWLSLLEIYLVI